MGERRPVRVLIEPGTYDLRNMGDVAMLQTLVTRLQQRWPEAVLWVFSNDPEALARFCPGAVAVSDHGRRLWLGERDLLGRVHDLLPRPVSRALVRLRRLLRRRAPGVLRVLIRLKARRHPADQVAFAQFTNAIDHADVHVMCGQGTLADSGLRHADTVLRTMELSQRAGTVTAMLGQGVGPITDPRLIALVREVVPHAQFIALREGATGPTLLRALGVDADRLAVTGDEAVEWAYERRPAALGSSLGVNIRVAPNAGVSEQVAADVRAVLRAFTQEHPVSYIPLPIAAHGGAADAGSIRLLLAGLDDDTTGGAELDTPDAVIAAAGRCRAVVTGAYHSAVFALSQGVPAVCLAGSRYYADKFVGLADLFGEGCAVVWLDRHGWPDDLASALSFVWSQADHLREPLLRAAERQIAWSRSAVDRVAQLLESNAAPRNADGTSNVLLPV